MPPLFVCVFVFVPCRSDCCELPSNEAAVRHTCAASSRVGARITEYGPSASSSFVSFGSLATQGCSEYAHRRTLSTHTGVCSVLGRCGWIAGGRTGATHLDMYTSMGKTNAHVLPEQVSGMPITSCADQNETQFNEGEGEGEAGGQLIEGAQGVAQRRGGLGRAERTNGGQH